MKSKVKSKLSFLALLAICALFSGCKIYSLTGINIGDAETVSIQFFFNDSGQGPANMSQDFTERLKDYFLQNTNLALVKEEGDLQIEGQITGYRTQPVAPVSRGNQDIPDVAGGERLTITISASYVNVTDETFDFNNRSFSFYDDFDPATTTLTAAEPELIDTIFEQVIIDIFNATVANW